ncbi:group II intron reverse transcriptase/maturase [Methylocystaceae bacterium]|nr:group II intron reverse transcriptase/maturase [Methylocystaceae bacterium]
MRASESQVHTDTALAEIAWLSANNPNQVYHSLMHHFNSESLRCCFDRLDGKKAIGVDQISKAIYGENLSNNLDELITRMKRMAYQPGPVREVLIPKEGKKGATRPLGISNFEDKLIQKRMQEILESIYEPLFLDCSYGFRPGKSCHDALKDLHEHLYKEEVEVVIDVDLANFFGKIDRQMLKDMISMKIKDRKFMRYISRMFSAGVLADGELSMSDEGVVQGSCVSPVFSNIMAHYVIDLWLEETVKPLMRGNVKVIRYADDLVICCRYEEDAKRIKSVLAKRLSKYNLALNEEKTKMVNFSKSKSRQGIKQESFDFLGLCFYLGKSRNGLTIPKLKTSGKRYRSKLTKVAEWAKGIRNKAKLGDIWKIFCSKLRGHVQYYGVSFNGKMVENFLYEASKIIFKWLNRRSQRKSFSWEKFSLYVEAHPLPTVKIVHRLF